MTRRKRFARLAGCLCVFLSTITLIHAQGTVTFINNASTTVNFDASFGGGPVPVGYRVGLWWAPELTIDPELTLIASTEIVAPGRFVGGIVTTPSPGGGMAVLQIRAWSGNYSTYDAAANSGCAGVGFSDLWTQITGNANPTDLPKPIVPPTGGFTGIDNVWVTTWGCIPEPSILTFSVFGVAALILWRGRRALHDSSENNLD